MISFKLKLILISLLATVSAIILDPCGSEAANKPGANELWPSGIVPYIMNKYLPEDIHLAVIKLIKHWELSTCIRFLPRTTHWHHFVFFTPGERSSVLFDKDGSGIHEVSLSPSVSTNATELNLIFSKMLGVCHGLQSTSSKKQTKVLSFNAVVNAIEPDTYGFVSKKSINNYSCQDTCGYSTIIKNNSISPHLVKSPGYPNLYEANVDCVWSIYNTYEKSLSLYFVDVDIEKDVYCMYDYVEIMEVNATGTIKWFKRLCENSNDAIIVQNGSKLIIRFHSDSTDNGKGFKAQIMLDKYPHCTLNNGGCAHVCIPFDTTRICQCNAGYELLDDSVSCGDIDECNTNNAGCAQQCVNTNGSYYCECHLGYSRNSDNITCERCYEIYTNRQAVIIFSPSYPRVYSPFYNCVWKITNKKRQFYQMEISNFNLNYSPDCVHDYLKISDHANKLVLPNNGRLCGIHKQITIVSRTSDLTIHFRSQARGGTGFKLVYWQLPERKRRYTMIDGTLI